MKIVDCLENAVCQKGLCATIGNFDGVHIGHRALIERAKSAAKAQNLDLGLITFWPHPRQVLASSSGHMPLSTRKERANLLNSLKIPLIVELPFTADFAALSAEEFVMRHLMPAGLRHLVVGHDFSLGRGREGNSEVLDQLAQSCGFTIERLAAVTVSDQPVSSSRLRHLLAEGKVQDAALLLGRFYSVEGIVEKGLGRGHKLGFPTANLGQIHTLLPAQGAYATLAEINGKRFKAMTNIGLNPTFNGQKQTVESFLLDASGDLYGQRMRLEFVRRLRPEQKFHSPEALVQQLGNDVIQARKILETIPA